LSYTRYDIKKPDTALRARLQHKIDFKTKPLGSLGRLEDLALKIGEIQQTLTPQLKKPTLVIYAGDHGLTKEGVSPYPQEVTLQMVKNFIHGGAAVNVFSKHSGLDLVIVDAGVAGDLSDCADRVLIRKIAAGTKNMLTSQAMTLDQLHKAMTEGALIVDMLYDKGVNTVGLGEMGIGNSSSAALLTSYLCGVSIDEAVERGAGCNDETLRHKHAILKKVREFHGEMHDPLQVLAACGGFELAMSVGHILRACEKKMVVLIDGYIMSSAALVAAKICPEALSYMIFCHHSASSGYSVITRHLGVTPVIDLGMRLGEGSGVAVALPIIQAAIAFLNEMASFEDAGVSEASQ
jgi:nicotinate-nucleotide--dimethylbenzimidazole phosphoribosyltransferase